MSQVLYRKYRPRSFDEVVGQDHIVKTLQSALKQGKLSHAYLFTGPRGVGKTSVARILAYSANGLDYSDGPAHLDIIEIDGASNRRIEEIRDLRDKVNIMPAFGKYKVYIIDEVHMLTKEAFNALLKTLEEPPAHTIFILATTESHKLPDTIVSRTQRFNFHPINQTGAAKHLGAIAKKEKIEVEPEALELLAVHGDSSFRDSISLLDQLSSSGQKVTTELVSSMLGLPPAESVDGLVVAIESGDSQEVVKLLESSRLAGINPNALAKSLSDKLRQKLASGEASPEQISLLKDLLEVSNSPMPQERLEISLLEASSAKPGSAEPEEIEKSEPKPKKTLPAASQTHTKVKSLEIDLDSLWPKILSEIKQRQPSLSMALNLSKPSIKEGRLILAFEFPLYKNRVAKSENRRLISEIAKELSDSAVPVDCVIDKDVFAVPIQAPPPSISNIFGGGEVLESQVSI